MGKIIFKNEELRKVIDHAHASLMYRSLFYSIVAGVISSCRDASKKTHPVSGKIYKVHNL